MLNPINHARTPDEAERYKVEPYVVAADIYSVAPHVGRGGWTWYTGAAGWMQRAGVEGILGIRRVGDHLHVDPRIPALWPGFEATVTLGETICRIAVRCEGVDEPHAWLDDVRLPLIDRVARIPLDGQPHELRMRI